MEKRYFETTMFGVSIANIVVNSKAVISVLKEQLADNKVIDLDEVERVKESINKELLINNNIFINIKTEDIFDKSDILNSLANGVISEIVKNIEVIGGIDTLKALDDGIVDINLVANVTFNLNNKNKLSLFKCLNKGCVSRVMFNRKLAFNLVDEETSFFFKVAENLNTFENSPLRGRINFSGESIPFGLNCNSIVTCLKRSKVIKTIKSKDDIVFTKVIINMLIAFKEAYSKIYLQKKFPDFKICDFRYIMNLLPDVYEYCVINRKSATVENILEMAEIIKKNDSKLEDRYLNAITGETLTVSLAKEHGKLLLNHDTKQFVVW